MTERIDRRSRRNRHIRRAQIGHRIINRNKYAFELFKEGSDGKVIEALDITYMRK